jgi:hypothetical protein
LFRVFADSADRWLSIKTPKGSLVGMQDIDFECDPVLSKAYRLTGGDEEEIRLLFRPEVLAY